MKGRRRPAMLILLALVGAYLATCVGLFVLQDTMVYPVPDSSRAPTRLTLESVPEGTELAWIGAGDPTTPVIVHFHGNAEQVADLEWLAQAWTGRGYRFAAVEYPGYPRMPGAPREAALVAAGEAALKHLTERLGVERGRLRLVGQSLGSGVAVQLAARGWGAKVLLLTPYTSLRDVGQSAFPWLPVRWLLRDAYDSASRASDVQQPVLVVHGTDDEVIPFALGRRLAGLFRNGVFHPVEGGHHNDLWDQPGVFDTAASFLR